MSTLRISDAPLLPDVDGTEKIPTGGRGDYAISVDQIKDHIFQDVGKELVGLGNVDNTSDLDKPVSTAQQVALNLKADKTYVDTNLDLKADKTNVYTRSETSLALSKKADLVNGVVPENQIPSSFNDVLEFTTPNLPIVGESGKIYVTTDNNKTWRWSANRYVEISGWNPDSVSKRETIPTYYTKEAGVYPVTGVADGAYFNVRSTDEDVMLVEYRNVGGVATPTGKSYPSNNALNNIHHNNLKNRDAGDAHPSSAILDASGKSQQEINDGIPSLSNLRLIDPQTKGRRVYLNSVIADKNLGAGTFVSTNKSSLVDNGGTIVDSANPNLMWVRVEYDVMTPEMFGCIGDGVTDDTSGMALFAAAKYSHKVAANDYLLTTTPTFNIEHDSTIIDFSKSIIVGTNFAYTTLQVEVNKSIKSLNIKTGSYNGGGVVNGYLEVLSAQPSGYADIINIECFGNLENFSNEKNTRSTFGILCAVPTRVAKVINPVVSNVHNKNGTPSVSSASGVALTNYQMLGIIENPIINGVYTSTATDADGLVLFEQKDAATTGTGIGIVKKAKLTQCCGRGIKSQSNLVVLGADIDLSAPVIGTVISEWRGIDAQLGGMYCKGINYDLRGAQLFNVSGDTALFQSSGGATPQDQIVKNVTVKGDSNIRYYMLLASNNHKNVVIDQVRLLDAQANLNCLYVTAGNSVTGSVSISNMSSGWWSNGRLFFDTTYTGSNIQKLNISNVDWDGFQTIDVSKFNKIRIVGTPALTIQGLLSYDAISKDSSFYYNTDGSTGGITYSKPIIPEWARRYCHYDKGVVYSTFRNNVLTLFGGKFYQSLGTAPTEIV